MFDWRTLRQPDLYHGHGRTRNFFEGWYFKLIDSGRQHRYAIIPGVFLGKNDPAESHAFVQVLDGMRARATYTRYPLADFHAARDRFDLRIGPNHFTRDSITLDLDGPERRVSGQLRFSGLTPWPVTLAAPGIMGWYAYLPFMECYHGVVSLDHGLAGELTVDGETIDFSGGRGYTEKDWGQAFPAAYIWLQSNLFEAPGVSLTGSVATIPWLGRAFRGFIVGLWHAGTLYRFTTYTGGQIARLALTDTHVDWVLTGQHRGRRLRLSIQADRSEGGLLRSPERTAMLARVAESMTSSVDVRLEDEAGEVLFAGRGDCACLETVGDLARILDAGRILNTAG